MTVSSRISDKTPGSLADMERIICDLFPGASLEEETGGEIVIHTGIGFRGDGVFAVQDEEEE